MRHQQNWLKHVKRFSPKQIKHKTIKKNYFPVFFLRIKVRKTKKLRKELV